MRAKKIIFKILLYENGKYLRYIIGDSAITCDEIIEVTKTISKKTGPTKITPTNFN